MDYSILNKQLEKVNSKYPWLLPVPPMALAVGIGFVLTLLGGVVFAIKLYRVGITVREAKGIAKTVTTQPPIMLPVYSKAISPGQDSEDRANQPSWLRRRWDQYTTKGGTRFAPNTDERHPSDSPVRREDRHQVREILGPTSQATRTRGTQPPPLPNTGVGGAWGHPPRLQFVRLSPTAKPPARSTEGAIGYDLYTPFSFTLYPKEIKLVYNDIAIRVPPVITVESHQNQA